MANIKLYTKCPQCGGDGIRQVADGPLPPVIVELPCAYCSSTGYVQDVELDSTKIDNLLDKANNIVDKCNNIIDKCNNIKDKCDQIWNKVNV